ncbi:hypothetical protein FE782_23630 [Paenibacillus antri]|uniref:Uncharacterized protein n=1 Tax=Paenibacillus antri TaxID=2582848 RepID=A0A5R9G5Q8_9BACL|nr:hypothetical protein [Paenibacillus antri]TLS49666.1 hypothetical protein FE782_23630 [Paenibacillus antri]
MWSYAKSGWAAARRSWFLLFLIFFYQYGWGFALYKYVKSIVVPLLHRYPGGELAQSADRLFWLEAEFQLTKTGLIAPYAWTILVLLLVRMLITPLLNAGIYNALANGGDGHRKAFVRGAKTYAKPFLLLYGLQTLLTFAPLVWAIPRALAAASTAYDWPSVAAAAAPYAIGWLVYQGILDLAFMYIGFGIVEGRGGWAGLGLFARRGLPIAALALATFAVGLAVSLAASALSLWWAGFLAVVVHQSYPIVRALLKLWGINAQYHLWSAHR